MRMKSPLIGRTGIILALGLGLRAHAGDNIRWDKGLYKSWSCKLTEASGIHEAPARIDLYMVSKGTEGPSRNYTFDATAILVFERVVRDPLDPWQAPRREERNLIAFKGVFFKDETSREHNIFRFEAASDQPIQFSWQDGKGEIAYQKQNGAIECRYPDGRTQPPH